MKQAALIVLLLIVGFSAIAGHHKRQKKSKVANEIVAISMSRTGCYGRCPTYNIEINKNGMATYTAIRFNADSGVFTKNIGMRRVAEILDGANDARIDTFRNEYKTPNTDLPSLIFKITYTDSVKTIYNAKYGPPFLYQLTQNMDGIAGKKTDETWHRQSTATGH